MSDVKDRLKLLIGDQSVSSFARQVGLSESLIRSYLKGTEPSLSKAWQICQRTSTSLAWLASGVGAPLDQLEQWHQIITARMDLSEAEWQRLLNQLAESQRPE